MRPTMDEIVRDPAIYRHFRRVDIQAGRVLGGIGRMLITAPYLGWTWFLGRGVWRVRPLWVRIVWFALPFLLGLWAFGFHVIGILSCYFWFPLISGWVWEKRLHRFVVRSEQAQQYQDIESEIAQMRQSSAADSGQGQEQYQDPNRLKS